MFRNSSTSQIAVAMSFYPGLRKNHETMCGAPFEILADSKQIT